MDYHLFYPSLPLAPYIQFYGLLQYIGPGQQATEDLIPPYPGKGLIFALEEDPPVFIHNAQFKVQATEGYFMPQCTHSWNMRINGRSQMLGVFFRPGMFRRFFRLPPHELTNRTLTFEDVGHRELTELQYCLLEPASLADKVKMVEAFLKKQHEANRFRANLTDQAFFLLRQNAYSFSVDTLKDQLGVSARYFRKIFQRDIGIPPKLFLKIHRFNTAFQLMQARQYNKLSDIAYHMNYYDQSHFIREFRYFTGTTPLQFLKQEHPLHDHLYWREGS